MIHCIRLYIMIMIAVVVWNGAMFAQGSLDTIRYTFPAITTTGTRVAEPWLEVPLALTLVQQSELHLTRGYGLDEALVGVPGVLAQSRFGNQDIRLTIRGFGARLVSV